MTFRQEGAGGQCPMLRVPYFVQSSESTCGPACLRMVLEPLGISCEEKRLEELCQCEAYGCTVSDLVSAATALGASAALVDRAQPMRNLSQALEERNGVVVMIDIGASLGISLGAPHFVVVIGEDEDYHHVHDPALGPNRRIRRGDFLWSWTEHDFRGVIICRPPR
ncbi:MAG: C39 family peptidase [Armatimonadetes bacterium]|nr:C39 family peptidase [Armatimonadota bacterium]